METPGLDPRSPATTFDRTPIMKPKSPKSAGHIDQITAEQSKSKIQTISSQISYCETTTDYSIPEIQALSKIMPLNFEQRLAECDKSNDSLDANTSEQLSSDESESEGQITVIPNLMIAKINPSTENEEKLEAVNKAIRVWRDSVSPKATETAKTDSLGATEEIIIDFDDDQLIVKPRKPETVSMKMEDKQIISTAKPKKVQQLSKESKPIYEDAKDFSGDGLNVEVPQNRTPLGNRSNNHKLSLPSKSPQQLLRNKGLTAKSQQQENTPPRVKHYKSKGKTNGTWDLDRTVVI